MAPPTQSAREPDEPDGRSVELHQQTLVRVLARLIRLRGAFLPVLLGFVLWIGLSDAATWRRLLMLAIAGVLISLIVHDGVIGRRIRSGRLASTHGFSPNLAVVAVMQHVVVFATGGMASPVIPVVLLPVTLAGLMSAPRYAWALVGLVHLPALWITTAVQLSGAVELTPTALSWPGGGGVQPPITTVLVAILMSFAILLKTIFATLTASGLNRMVDEALRSRDSALADRKRQARELTTLSGEIAHELKNPLASVKGLAQLVGRELERSDPASKSAERMAVLRREVDRMQGILDEFLNFSRPLVPLDQREVELGELVAHVVDLHEGVALERGVTLRASGQARVACDPRKVEQILINLVQNALEVAPSGTAVELELGASAGGGVRVEVRDHGPGLAASVRGRAFEPGVTGKAEGSGLGLTIARALARQHGGELELGERDEAGGDGCVATLSLPARIHAHEAHEEAIG